MVIYTYKGALVYYHFSINVNTYHPTAEYILTYNSATLENTRHYKLNKTGEKATISLEITPVWVKTILP